MSRGLGRVERAILAALQRRRQPLLADRWHPLPVELRDDPADRVRPNEVGLVICRAVSGQVSRLGVVGAPLPEDGWNAVIDAAVDELNEVHAEPFLGQPLSELVNMVDSADNPHAVEVSVQRAAKRLEEKSLIQRRYVTGITWPNQTRTFVCARITPTDEELAEAAKFRAQAKDTHYHHTLEGVRWIRNRGQTVKDYSRAATQWLFEEENADWKWLKWFGNL